MARLYFTGFESGDTTGSTDGFAEGGTGGGNAQATIVTTTPHGGSYCLQCVTASSLTALMQFTPVTFTVGNNFYIRFFVRKSADPANAIELSRVLGAVSVRLNTNGTLSLLDSTGTQIGSASAALSSSTWYRVEYLCNIGSTSSTGATELRIDGNTVSGTNVSNANLGTTSQSNFSIGWSAATISTATILFDDVAVNDTSGTAQNTWPGDGKIVHLWPTGDSAVGTGWTLGTGTAISSNGFAAVDNIPPVGVADLTAGSDTKQIRNATSNANSAYNASMTTYTAAGLASTDMIQCLQATAITGAPSATNAKSGSMRILSNPVDTGLVSFGTFYQGAAIAGTYPAGWTTKLGVIFDRSNSNLAALTSANYGTAPVMSMNQVTSSTRIAMVCDMSIRVEYSPQTDTHISITPATETESAQTLSKAKHLNLYPAGGGEPLPDSALYPSASLYPGWIQTEFAQPLSVHLSGGSLFTKTAADTLGTTDAATRSFTRARTTSDTLGTTDAATRAVTLPRVAFDLGSPGANRVTDASFEIGIPSDWGTSGYGIDQSALSSDGTVAFTGSKSLKSNNTTGTSGSPFPGIAWTPGSSVVFEQGYTYLLRFMAKSSSGTPTLGISFGNIAGFPNVVQTSRTISTTWTKYEVTWTPDTRVVCDGQHMGVYFLNNTNAQVMTFWLDDVQVVAAGTGVPYYLTGDKFDAAVGTTVSIFTRTGTDTLGTTDAATRAALSRVRTTADTLGTTDAATRSALSFVRTTTDTLGTTDAATRAAALRTRTTADTLGTTDVAVRATQTFARTTADTLGTTDAATRAAISRVRTTADTLGTTDTATRTAQTLVRITADTLGTTDSVVGVASGTQARTGSDTLGTTDAATRAAISRVRTTADTLGTTDAATNTRFVSRAGSDTLGTTDAATRATQTFARTTADTLGTTDAATRSSIRARSTADTLGTTDAATRATQVFVRATTDTLGTSDAAFKTTGINSKSASDTLGTTDAATRATQIFTRSTADTLGTTDAATRSAPQSRASTDTLGTTDAATRGALSRVRTTTDTLGTTDTASRTFAPARTTTDTLGTTDAATRGALSRIRAAVDGLGTTDAASRTNLTIRSVADTLGTTDAATRSTLLRIRTTVDVLGTTDTTATYRALARVVFDSLGTTDSADGAAGFSSGPPLLGPLHVLVFSTGTSQATITGYIAKAPVLFEPTSSADVNDYVGKATIR